jgi:hypothetical protein
MDREKGGEVWVFIPDFPDFLISYIVALVFFIVKHNTP